MPIKVNGLTSGSVTLAAPDTGSDVTVSLPGVSGELLPLAGGKILQIVRATDTTNRSTTSTSYVDVTGLSVTITPQKSDSAILLLVSANVGVSRVTTTASLIAFAQITDASNNEISGAQAHVSGIQTGSTNVVDDNFLALNMFAYATPATTSPVTYKTRFRTDTSNVQITFRNSQVTAQMYAIEVSA